MTAILTIVIFTVGFAIVVRLSRIVDELRKLRVELVDFNDRHVNATMKLVTALHAAKVDDDRTPVA